MKTEINNILLQIFKYLYLFLIIMDKKLYNSVSKLVNIVDSLIKKLKKVAI